MEVEGRCPSLSHHASALLRMATDSPAPASKKRFVGRSVASASSSTPHAINQIPTEILDDPLLKASIEALLPANYSFEVQKCVWQIKKYKSKRIALQVRPNKN